MPIQEVSEYPMRLNRWLALRGIATRRAADELIVAGKVRVNGQIAVVGQKVSAEDTVEVSSRSSRRSRYFAYYKPRGIITHSPQRGERSISDILSLPKVFPVGRLDKESEGLIMLTDDGRVTERLLHPRFVHEKEYVVDVRERLPANIGRLLERGIESEGEWLAAKRAIPNSPRRVTVVLTEGKKHQIRRMLGTLHLTVERLCRVRIMGVRIGTLRPGEYRELVGVEREHFLRALELKG
jgi:pseudouridine synthase